VLTDNEHSVRYCQQRHPFSDTAKLFAHTRRHTHTHSNTRKHVKLSSPSQAPPSGTVTDALVEASVWLTSPMSSVTVVVRAGPQDAASSRLPPPRISVANCTSGTRMNNTDVCPGGPPGYRDADFSHSNDPFGDCAEACCAWPECTAWIVRNFTGEDFNCSGSGVTCCWLKPGCSEVGPSQFYANSSESMRFISDSRRLHLRLGRRPPS
jgi:hypothetical protein